MKNRTLYKYICLWPMIATLSLTACIEEELPSDMATAGQIEGSSNSLDKLVKGLNSKMISESNYYNSSYAGTWYATQDWGYPCYMYIRETMLDGFPTTDASWNYQLYYESGSNLTGYTGCPYFYYYSLIDNANRILKTQDEDNMSESVTQNMGIARVYRALSYMDLSMMFEFYPTEKEELNAKAKDVWGLTVPIVTENTTLEEGKNNPRVPFYTMYRFIYNDLSRAEEALHSYVRSERNEVNIDVVNALLSRSWLTLATRFRKFPDDLTAQLSHEGDADRGRALGITTAEECYQKAAAYADKVINAGYTPVTKEQWKDAKTGFNTANQAWVWDMRVTSQEQYSSFWCSIMGLTTSEATWAMPAYGDAYRCISNRYYNMIQAGDWRRDTWIAPEDAGSATVPARYNSLLKDESATTKADRTCFSRLPAYANLKFRPGSGSIDDELTGMLCDIPLIRVEEMHFIKIECAYYLNGLAAGCSALESFLNTYRFDSGYTYTSEANYGSAFIYEMIAQKYIEFWGEGIMYNDFKRLRLAITRMYEGSNYLDTYKMESKDGYCAPWLNFYLPDTERSFNRALDGQMNPDPTPYCKN